MCVRCCVLTSANHACAARAGHGRGHPGPQSRLHNYRVRLFLSGPFTFDVQPINPLIDMLWTTTCLLSIVPHQVHFLYSTASKKVRRDFFLVYALVVSSERTCPPQLCTHAQFPARPDTLGRWDVFRLAKELVICTPAPIPLRCPGSLQCMLPQRLHC